MSITLWNIDRPKWYESVGLVNAVMNMPVKKRGKRDLYLKEYISGFVAVAKWQLCNAAVFSEETPKPEGTTGDDGTKAAEAEEAPSTQSKTKKSTKEEQTVMTNVESLYFANTHLFPGLIQKTCLLTCLIIFSHVILFWKRSCCSVDWKLGDTMIMVIIIRLSLFVENLETWIS